MKRILSIFLTVLMILPVFAGVFPVSAVDAFNVDEVEAKYFDVKPVIDGYISEAEWGSPVVLAEQGNAQTVGGQSPFPNRFFAARNGGGYDTSESYMSYLLWLSWDENYFYIGAKVNDPDGHSNNNGRGEIWDGDALQVRIDPLGANGINGGIEFDPKLDAPYDYKPWSSYSVCDLRFGYSLNAGGFNEAWNSTPGVNQNMLLNTAYTQSMGLVDMAIGYAGSGYTADTENGITTYEIAIPWSYIDYDKAGRQHNYYKFANFKKQSGGVITQGPDGAIGYEYGMSAVVFNADGASGGNYWNALLTWGSGIAGIQHTEESYKTCAGSNAVILAADKVSEDPAYDPNFATYTVGGPIPPPIPVFWTTAIDAEQYVELTYDDAEDMEIFGDVSNGERVQLEDGNRVVKWDLATDRDLDEWDPGYNPEEPTHNSHNYLSTEGYEPDGADARWVATGEDGPSFTFEFDIMVTDLVAFESGYSSFLVNWFGGTSAVDYQCGYFFDDSKFKIVNYADPSEVVAAVPAEFSLNEWHHWVFQYDNETCTLRFYFDPPMAEDGLVSPNAYPVFNLRYRYFDYGSLEKTVAIFRRMNAQIMMDNVRFYNFVDFTQYRNPDIKNYVWEFENDISDRIVITGYTGENTHLNIPSSIGGYTVCGIAEGAFEGLDKVTKITIPHCVEKIGEGAFSGCTSLTTLNCFSPYIECNLVGKNALEGAVFETVSDDFTFSLDFNSSDDVTKVAKIVPEANGLFTVSMPETGDFMLWVLDKNGDPLENGFRRGIVEMSDFWCYIAHDTLPFTFNAVAGEEYYVVVRGISPDDTSRSFDFTIDRIPRIAGDADHDGQITPKDVLRIRMYLGGVNPGSVMDVAAADVNGDGKVTVKDVLTVRKYLGGVIDKLQ